METISLLKIKFKDLFIGMKVQDNNGRIVKECKKINRFV
jgi:hypothetical protein